MDGDHAGVAPGGGSLLELPSARPWMMDGAWLMAQPLQKRELVKAAHMQHETVLARQQS